MTDACDSEVQNTVELPQVQHIERIVDVTVVMQHQVPTNWSAQKMVEVPQSQCFDRVVDTPRGDEATGMILQETRTAEIPQMPFADRIVSRVPACTIRRVPVAQGRRA